jgi:hypothetical protein
MTPRGQPLATQINAVLWSLRGMSMHRIAFLLRVSAQAVLIGIRDCATDSYAKREPSGRTRLTDVCDWKAIFDDT